MTSNRGEQALADIARPAEGGIYDVVGQLVEPPAMGTLVIVSAVVPGSDAAAVSCGAFGTKTHDSIREMAGALAEEVCRSIASCALETLHALWTAEALAAACLALGEGKGTPGVVEALANGQRPQRERESMARAASGLGGS